MEGDLIIPQASTKVKHFNPLPPCGGRLSEHPSTFLAMYFNPLPPCGGRLYGPLHLWYNNSISIHSLRVEGDIKRWALTEGEDISIHSLRVEGDSGILADCLPPSISIHSLRVEGDVIRCMLDYVVDFNPLPPCGGRPSYQPAINHNLIFQSTPSVWRETVEVTDLQGCLPYFNPLPPCGGRPAAVFCRVKRAGISIHSLRVEGDYIRG